ncbi:hypothetical protein FXO38_21553 [Capsicum annuum]|nr:hypothetical protein FXO38_21553 [Capsicum annuum]
MSSDGIKVDPQKIEAVRKWPRPMTPIDIRSFLGLTNGKAECTIHTLEDMLRACVIDFKGSWVDHLPLIEFSYNNSYHASIKMSPFEALYGRRCRSLIGWYEVGEIQLFGLDLVHQAMEDVKILRRIGAVVYELELPADLDSVHPVFHISMLKKCIGDHSLVFPVEENKVTNSLAYEEEPIAILDLQVWKLKSKEIVQIGTPGLPGFGMSVAARAPARVVTKTNKCKEKIDGLLDIVGHGYKAIMVLEDLKLGYLKPFSPLENRSMITWMRFFIQRSLGLVDTISDPMVELIKKELAGATAIRRVVGQGQAYFEALYNQLAATDLGAACGGVAGGVVDVGGSHTDTDASHDDEHYVDEILYLMRGRQLAYSDAYDAENRIMGLNFYNNFKNKYNDLTRLATTPGGLGFNLLVSMFEWDQDMIDYISEKRPYPHGKDQRKRTKDLSMRQNCGKVARVLGLWG